MANQPTITTKGKSTVPAAAAAAKPDEFAIPPGADTVKESAAAVTTFKPKVKRIVTVPVLTMKPGETYYIKFLTKITTSKVTKGKKGQDGDNQKPAEIAQVVLLDTGEARTLIVNAVLASIMHEEYPGDTYVEKGFQVEPMKPKDGQRYKGFSVAELEL